MAEKDSNSVPDAGPREVRGEIDFYKRGGIEEYVSSAGSGRRQSMRGFDEDYTDIVDYIVRSTHKIWEQYGMGLIYTHYAHNAVVHTPYGITYGREEMIAQSIASLSAFPDRKAYADDVVWTGDDVEGFHTSHRITTLARNTGHSVYGPPTGRKVNTRVIANCFVRENRIREEWLVRDNLALVRQLGFDENRVVEDLLADDERKGLQPSYGQPERIVGQTGPPPPRPDEDDGASGIEAFVRRALHEVWNWRRFDKVTDYYIPNYICYTVPNRRLYGAGDFRAEVMAFVAAFPDIKLSVDHVYWLGNDRDGYRVATRWTMLGTHDGPGVYGPPTGNPVEIMGITQHHVVGGRFVKEWTVFDGIALLKQLRSGRAATNNDYSPEEA